MEALKKITVQEIMSRIDAKCYAKQVLVITPVGNLISRLDDQGRFSAATMIVNGSDTARSLFLDRQYKAVPMSEIMDAIDKRVRAEKAKP